jgi:hypothetical protein
MRSAKVLRLGAFGFMALFGLVGTLFVAGYAFDDPGGTTAVVMTAAWVVPMAALSVYALLRPDSAAPVLTVVTALVLVSVVADALLGIVPRDDWGPVGAITVFSLGVVLAFLGLHRPSLAGLLMTVAALTQLVGTALGFMVRGGDGGPGAGAMLGGSSGVVVLPLLLAGAAFWVAGRLAHEPVAPVGHQPQHAH